MPKVSKDKQVQQFKLLVGHHVGPDMDVEEDDNGRRPSKTYGPGDVIRSEVDLVAKLGADKFQLIGTEAGAPGTMLPTQSKAPQGQVGTGFQVAEGGAVTGEPPVTPSGIDIRAETAEDAMRMAHGQQPEKQPDSAKRSSHNVDDRGRDKPKVEQPTEAKHPPKAK